MKGRNKRKKSQFTSLNQPVLHNANTYTGPKARNIKRTYIRPSDKTLEKVRSIPTSVMLSTAKDVHQECRDMPVLLRPRTESSILEPKNINTVNNTR